MNGRIIFRILVTRGRSQNDNYGVNMNISRQMSLPRNTS